MNKKILYIAFITSFLMAVTAAFFSISGLSKLFSGAAIYVIVFASVMEIGKLISVSILQNYWTQLKLYMKTFLFIAVIFVMIITSAGVYGFLSDAYQQNANKFLILEKKVSFIDKKEDLLKKEIQRNEKIIESNNNRLASLTSIRSKQEDRIDNLILNNKNSSIRNTQKSISDGALEAKLINDEIIEINKKINTLNDSINVLENTKLTLSSSDIISEIGSLKYISTLTGKSMDKVVNILILMLVIVLDPLAIILLITAQHIYSIEKNGEKGVLEPKKDTLVEEDVNVLKEDDEAQQKLLNHIENKKAVAVKTPFTPEQFVSPGVFTTEQSLSENESNEFSNSDEHIKEFESYFQDGLEVVNKYKDKFLDLIDILYEGGKIKSGENLLNYIDFKHKVDSALENRFTNDDIKRFLTICNYLHVTSLNDGERKALVDFSKAQDILKTYFNN